ncbi:hypothetical protein IM543_11205 [Massilia sp. UMI-21]|nr:hypothetical protein IM543_11205 [Massilia sp. UMI-21]
MNLNTAQPSDLINKLVSSLDIDAFDDVPTGKLILVNPVTKEKTSTFMELASPEHEARKRIDLARTRRLRAEFAANGKLESRDPLEDIEDETDYLVASVLSWNVTRGGQSVECTAANVRALLADPKKQWVRAQVREGVHKTELFIADSAKA